MSFCPGCTTVCVPVVRTFEVRIAAVAVASPSATVPDPIGAAKLLERSVGSSSHDVPFAVLPFGGVTRNRTVWLLPVARALPIVMI